jgi:hypothetical protein
MGAQADANATTSAFVWWRDRRDLHHDDHPGGRGQFTDASLEHLDQNTNPHAVPAIDRAVFILLVDDLVDSDALGWGAVVATHLQDCPACLVYLQRMHDLKIVLSPVFDGEKLSGEHIEAVLNAINTIRRGHNPRGRQPADGFGIRHVLRADPGVGMSLITADMAAGLLAILQSRTGVGAYSRLIVVGLAGQQQVLTIDR